MCCAALRVLCCAGELRALLLPESFAKALRNAMAQAAQAAQAACEHEPGTEGTEGAEQGTKNGTNCCQMVGMKPCETQDMDQTRIKTTPNVAEFFVQHSCPTDFPSALRLNNGSKA